MDKSILVTTLFVDIGGVLLTDGWGHEFRKLAVKKFHLNQQEMEDRHQMVFETFELDKLTMEEYLNLVVFYQPLPIQPGTISAIHVCPVNLSSEEIKEGLEYSEEDLLTRDYETQLHQHYNRNIGQRNMKTGKNCSKTDFR